MKLIAGLGNPGSRYQFSRHNIGFMVLDRLADRHRVGLGQRGFGAFFGKGNISAEPVLLIKPQGYMNLSGVAVKKFFDYYRILVSDVIVVHDDLDLPFGAIRMKAGGGHAGHKGLISIIDHLGDADFNRIRFGIGKPDRREMVEGYVLSPFSAEEADRLPQLIATATEMLTEVLLSGIQAAMCKYHGKTINNFEEV
ncbi:MAG: aminoacyl-tRNA hydrolase [Syntrophus sp. (in: bacteria)]|nr:aminoacyl-tRNA hydrolase [Syntrophus sp. (in: bacteria)]